MANVDEFELRRAARDLGQLFRELDAKKYERGRPPEVRVMKPSFGPRDPANMFYMSLDRDLTARLFEMVGECRTYIDPNMILHHDGPRLCEWIAFNAQAVSELDVAPDLLDELHDQARRIGKRVNPPDPKEVAKRLEPYHRAEVIIQRAAQHGYTLTRDGLRKLAERSSGEISTERWRGRTTYRFTEVLNHLNRRAKR